MATLSGQLLSDVNENLLADVLDSPLENWTVALYRIENGTADLTPEYVTTTDASGNYTFDDVDQGQYIVRVIDTDGNSLNGYQTPTNSGFNYIIPEAPIEPNAGEEIDPNGDPDPNGGIVPENPDISGTLLTSADKVYTVTLLDNGNQIGGTDFEDADDLLAGGGNADNIALDSEADQVWADIGFKFWWDVNQDFVPDTFQGGNSMVLERRNEPSAPGTTNRQGTEAFVNDLATGPYDIANRFNKLQFDYENGEDVGLMGDYVLRGRGLYDGVNTVPTLLIEYTLPTSSGSGWIWDIDAAYPIQSGVPTYNLGEQWQVEVFTNTDQDGDANNGPDLLETIISPLGQSVWVPVEFQNEARYQVDYDGNARTAEQQLQTTAPDGRSFSDWLYNPLSLDGKHWEWSFDAGEAIVDFVRISYIGEKGGANDPAGEIRNVGLAFDRFQAFGEATTTADFLFNQPQSNPQVVIGDFVFYDQDGDGIQDANEEGVGGVTVQLLDTDGIVLQTTTTVDDPLLGDIGSYQFTVEGNADYQIQFVVPEVLGFSGFTTADVNGNTQDTVDSDVDANGLISLVSVGETDDFSFDAGLVKKVKIGDFLFSDDNGNGIQDAGEAGVDGATVTLFDANGDEIASTTTGDNLNTPEVEKGYYEFTVDANNTYSVGFELPTGFDAFTIGNQGTDDTADSDVIDVFEGEGFTDNFFVGQSDDFSIDAGLINFASLGNFVFEDLNANGIQDSGESGIPNAEVRLLDGQGNPVLDE
ncbi:MAG: SdrD B-like domain-containing protein, partial [Crocosphaera sp.]